MKRDRGEFRPIYEALVDGPQFRALTPHARLCFFALKLKCGVCGIRALPGLREALGEWTGLQPKQVTAALVELMKADWVRVEQSLVWIVRGLEFEPSMDASNAKHRKHVRRVVESLPSVPLVTAFRDAHSEWLGDSPPRPKAKALDTLSHRLSDSPSSGSAEAIPITTTTTTTSTTTSTQQPRADAREGAAAEDPLVPGVDVYRVQLTRAANEAITAKWGEQPTPLRAGSGYALELARDVQAAGVPLELAAAEIRAAIERRPASEGPPRAMTYFRQRILEAWATAKDEGRVRAPVMPAMSPEELWRLVLLTGLHRLDFAAREAAIQQAVAHGAIPEEAAFREAWGMVHVAAHRIVTTAKDSAQIVAEFRALLAKGQQQPMPKHMADLPHPYQGERPVNVEVAA